LNGKNTCWREWSLASNIWDITHLWLLHAGAIQIQNASNVHLGNSVSIGSNQNLGIQRPVESKPELTPEMTGIFNYGRYFVLVSGLMYWNLIALFENGDEVTNLHRLAVDNHIGSDWRFLGIMIISLSPP
jgi:hypothetical protein